MQNSRMKRILKWMSLTGLVLLLVLAGALFALQRGLGSDDFKARAEREASAALGAPVQLARLDVVAWPLPAVVVEGIQIQTRPALTLDRLDVRPAWSGLLRGQLELSTLLVHGALLPQTGVDSLLLLLQKKELLTQEGQGPEAKSTNNFQYMPQRTVLDNVTWVSAKGERIVLDADAQLSPQGLPQEVSIKILKGQFQGASARLQHQASDWTLAVAVGGGTVKGTFQWQPALRVGADFVLKGQLQTRTVEVAALAGTPQPVLSGALDADTTLSVRAPSWGALADHLQTQSKFTVQHAVLHGLDLAKAVKTVGLSRGVKLRWTR